MDGQKAEIPQTPEPLPPALAEASQKPIEAELPLSPEFILAFEDFLSNRPPLDMEPAQKFRQFLEKLKQMSKDVLELYFVCTTIYFGVASWFAKRGFRIVGNTGIMASLKIAEDMIAETARNPQGMDLKTMISSGTERAIQTLLEENVKVEPLTRKKDKKNKVKSIISVLTGIARSMSGETREGDDEEMSLIVFLTGVTKEKEEEKTPESQPTPKE